MAIIEEEQIDLCDGKYTVIFNNETGQFRALRYELSIAQPKSDEWRDLLGDRLIFSMFCEIQALKQRKDCPLYADYKESCQALKDRNEELKHSVQRM